MPEILLELPKPVHVFILADHGECFGEEGLWGHSFYHSKIIEVPFTNFIIPSNDNEEEMFLKSLVVTEKIGL
jgi:hypothetical protein